MASFKLKFRPSVTQGQEGTLYFQVIHRRVVKMIYTDFHIRQDEWNDTTSFIRITGTPERQAFLQLTASKVQWNTKQLTAIITDKETARVEYSTEDIVSAYKRLPPCQTWFGFIRDMAASLKAVGYREIQLGVDKGNPQSLAFWTKNGFEVLREDGYIVMGREI